MKTVKYTPELESRLRNVSSLKGGTGCKYLVCIDGQNGELVAKQWKRHKPAKLWSWETLVIFG